MLNLNLYVALGILEVILAVVVWAGVMSFKWRSASRAVADLRRQLREAPTVSTHRVATQAAVPVEPSVPPPGYADFLRAQIERSSVLLGEAIPVQAEGALETAQQDAEACARQMLAARHQFLQLELDTQDNPLDDDVQAQRQRIVAGMQALLEGLSWQPTAPAATGDAPAGRGEIEKLQEQIGHLRSVIDNQHAVMRELRQLLEAHGGDSEEIQASLRKLSDAETQAVELNRCLEVMEQENERLKDVARNLARQGAAARPDTDMLRDLVTDQQHTIGKLQGMLRNIGLDSGKSSELEDSIGKIQRSNNELNSCVMVLEDENTMLRDEVESLQARLAGLEAGATQAEPRVPDEVVESAVESVSSVAADTDALLGGFAQDAAPAPAVAPPEKKPAPPAEDDTDTLLADLFGESPSAPR